MQASDISTVTPLVPETARDHLLIKIKEDKGLPTLGAAISKVVEITSSEEDSVANLAHFVLADVGLTQKILRLSNTIHYRTNAGVPVTTISRAIFLLGFNAVKTSAMAMLLVDFFNDKNHSQIVRTEFVHSFFSFCAGGAFHIRVDQFSDKGIHRFAITFRASFECRLEFVIDVDF